MEISRKFDVVIVGGGPAGMAAALWCDELVLSSCLIEKGRALGGQLAWIHNPINNYPGAEFASGSECIESFKASLSDRIFQLFTYTEVVSIDLEKRTVETSAGTFEGDSIILAMGIRRRELGVPGEVEFRGSGILASGSRDRRQVDGQDVAVIGGGDAALENALILAEFANKVYLIHRRDGFSAREEFIASVAANAKIELILGAKVDKFGGERELAYIDIRHAAGASRRLPVTKAVVRIGVVPNSEILAGHLDLDERGYVRADRLGRTSADRVYAIGDIANPVSPTIATAVGSAANVVKAITRSARFLE